MFLLCNETFFWGNSVLNYRSQLIKFDEWKDETELCNLFVFWLQIHDHLEHDRITCFINLIWLTIVMDLLVCFIAFQSSGFCAIPINHNEESEEFAE